MGAISRDVARTIAGRDVGDLQEFKAELARDLGATDRFASGYREALFDVLSAIETELVEEGRTSAAATEAVRPNLQEILTLLEKRSLRPTDLADETEKEKSLVSRYLRELRELGLVEVWAADAESARERPHRLTERGRAVLARLPPLPARERVRPQTSWLRACLASVSTAWRQGRLSPVDVEKHLTQLDAKGGRPEEFTSHFFAAARESGLFEHEGGSALVWRFSATELVSRQLDSTLVCHRRPSAIDLLLQACGSARKCVLIAPKTYGQWERARAQFPDELTQMITIGLPELEMRPMLRELQVKNWVAIYEDAQLAHEGSRFREFIDTLPAPAKTAALCTKPEDVDGIPGVDALIVSEALNAA